MQQRKSRPRWCQHAVIGLLLAAALSPPAWAYINGRVRVDTFNTYMDNLQGRGWGVSVGAVISAEREEVNRLVVRAFQALPAKDASKISIEAKRKVARLTREALQEAASNDQQTTREGQIGSLRYQVGVYQLESYWESNERGKREIHDRRTGRVPFVALKIVDAKEQGK